MASEKSFDEFKFIKWIREQVKPANDVILGIGDDGAQLKCSTGSFIASTDMLLEGTHFDASAGWKLVGRKAMAVSLSDMAAMAVKPKFALCAAGVSDSLSPDDLKKMFRGMQDIAADFGCQIAGGDFTSWDKPTALCTTIFGEPTGNGPLRRDGAKVGDRILVTGELGGSFLEKHLNFMPRVIEAIYLNQNYNVNSCIDISDGLGLDLSHIMEESGVGAIIYADSIPVSDDAGKLSSKSGKTPFEHALSDGEDFELLFTMPPEEAQRLTEDKEFGTRVSVIGGITGGGFIIQEANGKIKKYKPEGYVHFRKND